MFLNLKMKRTIVNFNRHFQDFNAFTCGPENYSATA